jgi:hypothetical protein
MAKQITIPAAYITARIEGPTGIYRGCPEALRVEREAAHTSRLAPMLDAFLLAMADAFAAVNGKADSFTLSATDAINAAVDAEKMLADKGVPKASRGGTCYTVSSAGPSANAYRHAAIGTRYTLRRNTKGHWLLDSVDRISVYPKQTRRETLTVTPAARDAIVRHALAGIEIHVEQVAA